jgi:dolichyl-phosphate-mannose--protein O-mannosyl transferase
LGLAVAAFVIRLPGLTRPRAFVFDEVYYASDARDLLRQGFEQVAVAHPPLGKWLLTPGIATFGFTPLGWRIVPVLASVGIVVLVYVGARQVTADRRLAAIGAGLVAVDGLVFVMGRAAMLDILLALVVTAVATLLVAAMARPGDARFARRSAWVVAGLVGLAVGIKWAGVLVLPAALGVHLLLAWRLHPPGRPRRRAVTATAAVLVLVPVGVYVATWGVWLARYDTVVERQGCPDDADDCSTGLVGRAQGFVGAQRAMARFHVTHETNNRFAQPAWTWPVLARPGALLDKDCVAQNAAVPEGLDDGICGSVPPGGHAEARILAVANPVGWWAGVVAVGVLLVRWARRRESLAGLLAALALLQWVPWVATGKDVYSYYAVVLVPVLALAFVAACASSDRGRRVVAPAVGLGAVVAFVLLYPIWAGWALDPGAAAWRVLPTWP